MAKCSWCGKEFDPSEARRSIGRRYGAGTYDDMFPNGDVCKECAETEVSGVMGIGEELMEDMGWDD